MITLGSGPTHPGPTHPGPSHPPAPPSPPRLSTPNPTPKPLEPPQPTSPPQPGNPAPRGFIGWLRPTYCGPYFSWVDGRLVVTPLAGSCAAGLALVLVTR